MLRLHYAREQDIGRYLDLVAAEGEVYVQYWLHEGDPPVELGFSDRRESLIPDILKKYL